MITSDLYQGFSVNPLDITVILILLIFGIASYVRGFTASALTLAAWGGAYFVTTGFAPFVLPKVTEIIQPDLMAFGLTYAILFALSLLTLKMIAGMVGKIVKNSDIGSLDSAMGLLFGLVGGMFFISCLYMITLPFISENNHPDWFKDAKSRPLIQYGASMVTTLNPYFDEKRKDLEALERVKKMMPSFPADDKEDKKYKKENQEEMNKLFEKLSKD
ncbi:CvpA family protein [Paremcibacter congregatus]|uniref:CvpA family protein n=1 Tax=Paremcibacter congregatus TaxID=2043170 RepID=UPI0030EE8EA9|tara:strand:- start:13928 stop:14578 length:651 start_codon:yes stop_codon:yes gene_type:complete